jgi:hypothetical protein
MTSSAWLRAPTARPLHIDMETPMKRILAASALVALAAFATFPAVAATTTATTTTKTVAAKPAPMKVAAATPAKPVVLTFKLIDANHDGKISYDELKKYFPKLTKAEFAKADTDKSGFLNKAELAAFVKSQQPPKAPMSMTKAK